MATISVLIACKNHARFLPRSIASVLAQSRRPDEIVLIDDASTDETGAIMEACAAKHPDVVRLVRNEKSSGLIAVVQQGIDMMKGDYIAFSAADDWLEPDYCATALRLLEAYPEAALFSSLGRSIDDAGHDLGLDTGPIPLESPGYLSPEACRRALIEHDSWFLGYTTAYRRACLQTMGPYDEALGSFVDNFNSRMLAMRHGACFAPEPLACARKAPSTYSATTSSEPDKMREIGERAVFLMRTRYADVVPAEYVEAFENRFRYLIGSSVAHWGVAEIARRFRSAIGDASAYGIPRLFGVTAFAAKILLFWAYRKREIGTTLHQRLLHLRYALRWPRGKFTRLV